MLRFSARKRGFSLIESAIVLGIIGLIIGGIWVAATAVSNRNKINGTIALILLAHEEGAQLRKQVSGSGDNLSPILALKSPPGNYRLSGSNLTNGQQWFAASIFLSSGSPYLSGALTLNSPSGAAFSGEAKPDLCLEVSKKLLAANLGASGSISWRTSSFTTIASWTPASAKPDMTTLSTTCQTTDILLFSWYL